MRGFGSPSPDVQVPTSKSPTRYLSLTPSMVGLLLGITEREFNIDRIVFEEYPVTISEISLFCIHNWKWEDFHEPENKTENNNNESTFLKHITKHK